MRYILNSAVLTSFGLFQYEPLTHAQAAEWLRAGPFTSTVGYAETAEAMSDLYGIHVPQNRIQAAMRPGDEALVFRLAFPPGTPRLTPETKGTLGPNFILEHCEIGVIRCL
jgi:hypothetical protein